VIGLEVIKCFRCGECCSIPVELSLREQIAIYKVLTREQRKQFLESLTDQVDVAFKGSPIQPEKEEDYEYLEVTGNGKWLKSPCMFLKENKCTIYEMRPERCRAFYCKKTSPNQSLKNLRGFYIEDI
jgi:Fe-S-cluster containining protein